MEITKDLEIATLKKLTKIQQETINDIVENIRIINKTIIIILTTTIINAILAIIGIML